MQQAMKCPDGSPSSSHANMGGSGNQCHGQQEIQLSSEQEASVALFNTGCNVFLTGPAGAGKGVVLKAMIAGAISKHGPNLVAVTATTALAALPLHGTTVHAWAGLQSDCLVADRMEVIRSAKAKSAVAWRACCVLFIDEVGMCSAAFLDLLDQAAQTLCP